MMSYNVTLDKNNLVLLSITFDVGHLNLENQMNVQNTFIYVTLKFMTRPSQSMIKLCVYVKFKLVSAIFSLTFIFHQIIALQKLRVLLNLETVETKGKNYKNLNISRTKSFLDEIKRIFHSFSRAIIW